ncbi:MAG: hypothetical protein M3N29_08270 [Chloroflexota bacterium]|nr:hypothetical protein [Chloroflexota bacterium]
MADDTLFRKTDEIEQEQADQQGEPAEAAPVVGGMGQFPGSGATGLGGTGMAPAVPAAAAERAADDVTADTEEDEVAEDGA